MERGLSLMGLRLWGRSSRQPFAVSPQQEDQDFDSRWQRVAWRCCKDCREGIVEVAGAAEVDRERNNFLEIQAIFGSDGTGDCAMATRQCRLSWVDEEKEKLSENSGSEEVETAADRVWKLHREKHSECSRKPGCSRKSGIRRTPGKAQEVAKRELSTITEARLKKKRGNKRWKSVGMMRERMTQQKQKIAEMPHDEWKKRITGKVKCRRCPEMSGEFRIRFSTPEPSGTSFIQSAPIVEAVAGNV